MGSFSCCSSIITCQSISIASISFMGTRFGCCDIASFACLVASRIQSAGVKSGITIAWCWKLTGPPAPCSHDCTVVESDDRCMQHTHSLTPDNKTVSTQLSTDIKPIARNDDNTGANTQIGIFISQEAIPWEGKLANKTVSKWKHMAGRAKRKAIKKSTQP